MVHGKSVGLLFTFSGLNAGLFIANFLSLFVVCLCVYQNDEVSLQRKVRTEVIQLEDTLAQVRKEYEMLRIEFEQTLAANEQAGTTYFHVLLLGMPFFSTLKKQRCVLLRCSLSIWSRFPRPNQPGDASPYQHIANA